MPDQKCQQKVIGHYKIIDQRLGEIEYNRWVAIIRMVIFGHGYF